MYAEKMQSQHLINVNIEDSRHGNYKCLLLKHRTVDTLVMVFNCGVKVTWVMFVNFFFLLPGNMLHLGDS